MYQIECFPRHRDCLEHLGIALWNSLHLKEKQDFGKDLWDFNTSIADRLRSLGSVECSSEAVAIPIILGVWDDITAANKSGLTKQNRMLTASILNAIAHMAANVAAHQRC